MTDKQAEWTGIMIVLICVVILVWWANGVGIDRMSGQ